MIKYYFAVSFEPVPGHPMPDTVESVYEERFRATEIFFYMWDSL